MIKAIVFDCFGVLAKDGWLPFRASHFSHNPDLLEKAIASNKRMDAGLQSYEDFVKDIAKLAGLPVENTRATVENRAPNEVLFAYIRDELKPNYKIGFLSNAGQNWVSELFEPWQGALFDEFVISYQLGVIKPHPLMYETIAEKLGVLPSECVLIDDQVAYCAGAEAVGMSAIHFVSNDQAISELEQFLQEHTS